MAYVGLQRVEQVRYSGETSGYGEAYVDVYSVSTDSQGHSHVHSHKEWVSAQCRDVPYSGEEKVEITINVEDDPFEKKVLETTSSVGLVSGTVGMFQSEQIQQVSENALEIARSFKRGFNSVVASEISQQIGEVEERSKNSYQLLQTLKRKLDEVVKIMEKDYYDIKSRNVKQFDGINKLYTDHIRALDAASFAMSSELVASMQTYAELGVSMQTLLPEESSRTRNNLEVSRLKGSSNEIIGDISKLLKQSNAYNAFVQNKISNIAADEEECKCLPVLLLESDALKGDSIETNCFMHIDDITVRKSIEDSVKNALHSQASVINRDYCDSLQKKLEIANLNERELSVIKNLMDDSEI